MTFAARGSCDPADHLVLFAETGAAAGDGFADRQCTVELRNVAPGTYRVLAVGPDIAATETSSITIGADALDLVVRIGHAGDSDDPPGLGLASVSDLRVPGKAAGELGRANQSLTRRDWAKARNQLLKVLAIDQNNAVAYNDLGVVYANIARPADAAGALQKAIELDEHFATAHRNLGRLRIAAGDFGGAEESLNKAANLAPHDAGTLRLLAYAQYMGQHFDQAIETCREGHATLQVAHGFLHLVAADAYGARNKIRDAMAELRLYLSEEPNGDGAEQARKSLAELQTPNP